MEFDWRGYTNGTSGGPFLANVHPATGLGTVIGVIGGCEQGGDTPSVSCSARSAARSARCTQGRGHQLNRPASATQQRDDHVQLGPARRGAMPTAAASRLDLGR